MGSFKSAGNAIQDVLQFNAGKAAADAVGGAAEGLGIRSQGNPRQRAANEARQRAFEEQRVRWPVPVIGGSAVTGRPGAGAADGWGKGAQAVQQYDLSAAAGAAGKASGSSFNAALGAELAQAVSMVQAAAQQMAQALNFSASPTITPKFSAAPSGGGKSASLESLKSSQHAAFADYDFGNVG